ncbi:hypothetical protein DL93DRAFT_2156018 [Clavulina sp. PMI_390]|nr:hypothetical protein DL93DRAFT_2156018 [Clavulina sp. PMI_390]
MLASACRCLRSLITTSRLIWIRVLRQQLMIERIPEWSYRTPLSTMSAEDLMLSCTRRLHYSWNVSKAPIPTPASRISVKLAPPARIKPFKDEVHDSQSGAHLRTPTLIPGGRWVVALQQYEDSWVFRCWDIQSNAGQNETIPPLRQATPVMVPAIAQPVSISFPVSSSPPSIVCCDYNDTDDAFNFVVFTKDSEATYETGWCFTIVHMRCNFAGGKFTPSLAMGPSLDGSQLVPSDSIELEEYIPSPATATSLAGDVFIFEPEVGLCYFWDWRHNHLGYEDTCTGLCGSFVSRTGDLVDVVVDHLSPRPPFVILYPNRIPPHSSSLTPDGQHQPVYLHCAAEGKRKVAVSYNDPVSMPDYNIDSNTSVVELRLRNQSSFLVYEPMKNAVLISVRNDSSQRTLHNKFLLSTEGMRFWKGRSVCFEERSGESSGQAFGLRLDLSQSETPLKLFLCPDCSDIDTQAAETVPRQFCPISGVWMLPRAQSTICTSSGWDVSLFHIT